jgi:hypothetical protein
VGLTLTDAKVCFEQLEEERWKKFMQLVTEGTGMGEDDLCDLDQYLRDGRLGTAHLTETEKGHAYASAAKQSLGEVVTDGSKPSRQQRCWIFWHHSPPTRRCSCRTSQLRRRWRRWRRWVMEAEEVHATFSWSDFACIDNSWVLCMCQHIMLT